MKVYGRMKKLQEVLRREAKIFCHVIIVAFLC